VKKKLKSKTNLKGKKRHGFRRRSKKAGGKAVLKRRRAKGRKRLAKD